MTFQINFLPVWFLFSDASFDQTYHLGVMIDSPILSSNKPR